MEHRSNNDFEMYKERISVQDVLKHLGYAYVPKSGHLWPIYARGHGDKYMCSPKTPTCCRPGTYKSYGIFGLIEAHANEFPEYKAGMKVGHLQNVVCRNILNIPQTERAQYQVQAKDRKPFVLSDYDIIKMTSGDFESAKPFYPFFKYRGINLGTQYAFSEHFCITTRASEDGSMKFRNLAFPLHIPGKESVVGFEQRGYRRADGSSGAKLLAAGSNTSEGLWIANLSGKPLSEAKNVYWFESAYDAMAYYQMNKRLPGVSDGVFLSTCGSPTISQMQGVMDNTPKSIHHVCFDNDDAGNRFSRLFTEVANRNNPLAHSETLSPEMSAYLRSALSHSSASCQYCYYADTAEGKALLPAPLREKYEAFDAARSALCDYENRSVCIAAERQKLQTANDEARKDYEQAFNEACGTTASPTLIVSVREVPGLGFKDWDDQLLDDDDDKDKRLGVIKTEEGTGLDLDEDGVEDTVEKDNPIEDKHKNLQQQRR